MQVTRRFWAVVVVAAYFAAAAVVFERPVFLVGLAGLSAWLVGSQYAFAWTLARVDAAMDVDQTVTPESGLTTDRFEVGVDVSRTGATRLPAVVTLQPSPAVADLPPEERTCRLPAGATRTEHTGTFRCPIAGTATFEPPSVRFTDRFGLFRDSLPLGETARVAVTSPRPTDLRVARGPERALGLADSGTRTRSTGSTYHGLREYLPTDPASRIDWNATARIGDPQVLEFERDADRTVALVVDGRAALGAGAPGRTQFDYCREVALRLLDELEDRSDATAVFALDEEGLTTTRGPGSGARWYDSLRAVVRDLEPRPGPTAGPATGGRPTPAGGPTPGVDAVRALETDGSAFASAIRPFYRTDRVGRTDSGAGPLLGAVETATDALSGNVWTAVLTDDTARAETVRAVRLAARAGSRVLLFLAPRSLYEPDEYTDAAALATRYREFESFRRDLDDLPGVTAFEVSPRSRYRAVKPAYNKT
jgi:uncharacterized protein (DUF58 family)